MKKNNSLIKESIEHIKNASYVIAFTGAGISVESGIPPFRGNDGLWSRYDPACLDIDFFKKDPLKSWISIKEIFYENLYNARPNEAHKALARLEAKGVMKAVITQNIDNLHNEAGSEKVIEYHGSTGSMTCINCGGKVKSSQMDLSLLPPVCKNCGGILKPDFVFFGEAIPQSAASSSMREAGRADLMIVVGTTGEVMPAAMLPRITKSMGGIIIEINTEPSYYTYSCSDIFLQGKASGILKKIADRVVGK